MANISIGHKVRQCLDRSLSRKGIFFWILFPIILALSLVIYVIALKRRKKSYPKIKYIEYLYNLNLRNINIICIGNVLIGGTGKSPVVQKIARYYLEQNYIVAIASRGIGSNIKKIYCSNKFVDARNNIDFLSDENREHFEILNFFSKKNNVFYILQNKNRLKSLLYFYYELCKNDYNVLKAVLILDDGLQHFACPRNVNICLWSPYYLLNSPNYAMPIGPYREGFGKKSFQKLLDKFHYRFWSRSKLENCKTYKKNVEQALEKYNLSISNKDIIVTYNTFYFSIFFIDNIFKIDNFLKQNEIREMLENQSFISVVTGIANPKNFISDLEEIVSIDKLNTIFLDDHAEINNDSLNLLMKSNTIILTLKDILRWYKNSMFIDIIKEKNIIACSVDAFFIDINCNSIDINTKLTNLNEAE